VDFWLPGGVEYLSAKMVNSDTGSSAFMIDYLKTDTLDYDQTINVVTANGSLLTEVRIVIYDNRLDL